MTKETLIPVFKPYYGEEEIEVVREVLQSGWIGLGPKTAAFERAFAEFIDSPHVIALNSGTAALHLACIALELKPEDEVIVPALTFASTALAPLYVGAKPVFADIDPATLTIDAQDVERKITPRTKAIIPVHYGGTPADMEALQSIADKAGIAIIEDAAHACGSAYNGRKIGSSGNITCFSFHAVKNLAMGDGGVIVARSEEEMALLKRLRWVGIDKDTWARENRSDARYDWYYEINELGYKYHPNDITSAIGLVQLAKLDQANELRRKIAKKYREQLQQYNWIHLPDERENSTTAQHNFVIRVNNRESLRQFLAHRLISTGVHYMPLTQHPIFKPYSIALPHTDKIAHEILTLPLYPGLTNDDFGRIMRAIDEYATEFKPQAFTSIVAQSELSQQPLIPTILEKTETPG